jgi:hypothetical protein
VKLFDLWINLLREEKNMKNIRRSKILSNELVVHNLRKIELEGLLTWKIFLLDVMKSF